MDWFNYYGIAIMAIIMIPNIVYALKHKDNMADNFIIKRLKFWNKLADTAVLLLWFSIFRILILISGFIPRLRFICR